MAAGQFVEFGASIRAQRGGAAIEEDFGLKHEAVADHVNVGPIAQDVAQFAEKVGTIARQFLHALGQRHVEPLPEIGDAQLRRAFLFLRGAKRILQRGDLPAQRANLLVEVFDLSQCPGRRLFLKVERGTGLVARAGPRGRGLGCRGAQPVAFALRRVQGRLQLGDLVLKVGLAGPFQRKQLAQPRDLGVEPIERGVFACNFLRQVELRDHEHRQQKDHRQHQCRQSVDEAGPVIHAFAAGAGECHGDLLSRGSAAHFLAEAGGVRLAVD